MKVTDGKLVKRGKYWHWRFYLDGEQKQVSLKVKSHTEAREVRRVLLN